MTKLITLALVLAIVIGGFAMVFGEADDSPGLQGIGGIFIIGAIVGFWAIHRRR